MANMLTFTSLLATSADDKLVIFFKKKSHEQTGNENMFSIIMYDYTVSFYLGFGVIPLLLYITLRNQTSNKASQVWANTELGNVIMTYNN